MTDEKIVYIMTVDDYLKYHKHIEHHALTLINCEQTINPPKA